MSSGVQRGGPNKRRGSRGGFKAIGSRGRERGAVYTNKVLTIWNYTVTKIKQKLIHNAKVKKEFYKAIKNETDLLETPEHLKSIFEEDAPEAEAHEEHKEGSSDENATEIPSKAKQKQPQAQKNPSKPNPYKRAMAEVERQERERQAIIDAERKEREDAQKNRVAYYKKRHNLKKKYTEKNARGQPVMRGQINHLLDKIKKMN
ncbi:hypothetical protein K493DRAFT_295375 [Basidiobolus meristosporus CBS 931.73]|uniref:rRNA-processing protein FYV7 n=1 Tax=Basidiobolus meristosporus CBS 931.73 TaxID=1314790 RepID=A0A1Y1ZBS5_9FUNG|nr:hypothetical protein K493DRAFT_295375 [Basidiobolus meristosporus CBS 931.73]|eukprot:ORY07741.1 hypothetical protein K493DRAFT_295375 [Basidiobolus meristosporus CBS 931.73]